MLGVMCVGYFLVLLDVTIVNVALPRISGCALAPGTGVLVGARVVQGAGAALLLPGSLAIITHAFPERAEQARAIGVRAGVGSVALPAGPLLGGRPGDRRRMARGVFLNVPVVSAAVAAGAVPVAEPS